jgi:hypothetical protein
MSLAFIFAGLATILCGLIGMLRGMWKPYQSDGLMALGNGLFVIANAMTGSSVMAAVNAAVCAYSAYRWWKGGGGDDTKRRLRSAWKPFEPVRRTAPQAAS